MSLKQEYAQTLLNTLKLLTWEQIILVTKYYNEECRLAFEQLTKHEYSEKILEKSQNSDDKEAHVIVTFMELQALVSSSNSSSNLK